MKNKILVWKNPLDQSNSRIHLKTKAHRDWNVFALTETFEEAGNDKTFFIVLVELQNSINIWRFNLRIALTFYIQIDISGSGKSRH